MTADWWNSTGRAFTDFNTNHSAFTQNITTHLNRPAKVTKPGSRNQSPRNGARRRMTTQIPARTRSVMDSQRAAIHHQNSVYQNVRPTSWHPEYHQFQTSQQCFAPQAYNMPADTTYVHGLITPNAFQVVDEPYFDCPTMPLEQMTPQDFNLLQNNLQYQPTSFYQCEDSITSFEPRPFATMDPSDARFQHTAWHQSIPYMPQDITTAPTSPEFLPMPDLGQAFDVAEVAQAVEGDELVGMGLYDSPAQVQSANLLFGDSLPVRRKSLKLEESFEPEPQSDDCEDDAESEPEPELTGEQCFVAAHRTYQEPNISAPARPVTNDMLPFLSNESSYYDLQQRPHSGFVMAGHPVPEAVLYGQAYGWF